MAQQTQPTVIKSKRLKRKVSRPGSDTADSENGGARPAEATSRRSKARIVSEDESDGGPQMTPTQLSQQEQEQDVDIGAAMGEGSEGQRSEQSVSFSSSSEGEVWAHREHHAPIKKQQQFQNPARQGGSRARKYIQDNTQEQQKAVVQERTAAEQDNDEATNDPGRSDAGTHAIHFRHGQHPSLND